MNSKGSADSVSNLTVRPTLACIAALVVGLEDADQRRAVNAAVQTEVGELSHPLVRHCNEVFGPNRTGRWQPISSARPHIVYKAKSGPWRGAVHIDTDGQPWLIDAGRRRNDDTDDFYVQFATKDVSSLLPTAQDRAALKRTQAERRLTEWQRSIRSTTVTIVADACHLGRSSMPISSLLDGSVVGRLSISVDRLDAEGEPPHQVPAQVIVEVALDEWKSPAQRNEVLRQVASVIAPTEDSWDAVPMLDGTIRAEATISEARLEQILAAVQIDDDSHSFVIDRASTTPTSHSHFVSKTAIVNAVVDGSAVRALCGRWFVPSRDPGTLPMCEHCSAARATYLPR